MQPSRLESSKKVVPEVLTSNFSHELTSNDVANIRYKFI